MRARFPIFYGRACVCTRMAPLKCLTLTEPDARLWLLEDEYSSLANLIKDGDVEPSVQPPEAATFESLVERMRQRRDREEP